MPWVITFILFSSTYLFAQMQGLKPFPYDGNTGRGGNNVCTATGDCIYAPDNPAIGDILFVSVSCDQGPTPPGSTPPFPISDFLGNTWNTPTAVLSANAGRGAQALQNAWSKATIGGSDYFIIQGSGVGGRLFPCGGDGNFSYAYARFKNLNGTLDGGVVNGLSSHVGLTNVDIMSTSRTVTHNGEVAIGSVTDVANGGLVLAPYGNNTQLVSSDGPNNGGGNIILYFSICGVVGTTCTQQTVAYNSNAAAVMQTLYFIPDMAIVDTQLPDCAVGVVCKFIIHGVGGIAALTCTVTAGSLPNITGSGPGNCTFSGTPLSQVSNNVTFKIDDGTTNVSKTLSFKVGAAFKPMNVIQTQLLGNTSFQAFSSNVTCGNTIVVCMQGHADTHIGAGWLLAIDGTNNSINDNNIRITNFNRVPSVGSNRNGTESCAVSTPLQSTGPETIFFTQNQTSAYMLSGFMAEVQGQSIAEEGVFSHTDPTVNTTALSTVFNAPSDNMYDILDVGSLGNSAPLTSVNAPFTNVYNGNTGNEFLFGTESGSAAGAITGTVNFASTNNDIGTLIMGIRPRLPNIPCGETTNKLHIQSQVY